MRPMHALYREEGEGVSKHNKVGDQVGDQPQHDQQRRDDRPPHTVQDVPRGIELDQQGGEQGQPGQAGRRRQTAEHPGRQPALPAGRQHRTEGERAEDCLRVANQEEIGGGEDGKESGRPKGRTLTAILTGDFIQEDRRHHSGDVADQQRSGAGRQSGGGQCSDQRRVQREEGDQVAGIAGGGVTVGGEIEVVLGVPLVPGLAQDGERVGASPELEQRQAGQQDFHQQGQEQQAQPGRKPLRRPLWNSRAWGRISTRPAGRLTE